MKKYLVLALSMIVSTCITASATDSGCVTPTSLNGDGGDEVSPAKMVSRLPSDVDLATKPNRQAPQIDELLPTPEGSTMTNGSVGTFFGASNMVAEALVKIRNPATSYEGCRNLLILLYPSESLALKGEPVGTLQTWHTTYSTEMRALSVLASFVYAQRPHLSSNNFTKCKTHIRDLLLMTVGFQVTKEGVFREKIYNRPEDAKRKWNIFFQDIKKEFSADTIFPNEESLTSVSSTYQLGLRFLSASTAPHDVRASRTSSIKSTSEVTTQPAPAQNQEDIVRSLWRERASAGLYSAPEKMSKFLEVLNYSRSDLRNATFAVINGRWSTSRPNIQGLVQWLEDDGGDASILCRLPLSQLIVVLELTPQDAKTRWDRYQALAKKEAAIFSVQGIKGLFQNLLKKKETIDPQEEIWKIELESVLERLKEVEREPKTSKRTS